MPLSSRLVTDVQPGEVFRLWSAFHPDAWVGTPQGASQHDDPLSMALNAIVPEQSYYFTGEWIYVYEAHHSHTMEHFIGSFASPRWMRQFQRQLLTMCHENRVLARDALAALATYHQQTEVA